MGLTVCQLKSCQKKTNKRLIIGPWVKLCEWSLAIRIAVLIGLIRRRLSIINDELKKNKKWS